MKKKIIFLFVMLSLCMLQVFGTNTKDMNAAEKLPKLIDDADLLDDAQESSLKSKLGQISEKHRCDVVVVTTESLNGKTATQFADDFYDYSGYGQGDGKDGILLLVSMEDRDWAISTTGCCIRAFTDAGQEYMVNQFKPDLSDGYYSEAFGTFANLCDQFLTQAENGKPFDNGTLPREPLPIARNIFFALVGGIILAIIVVLVMASKLKSVHSQPAAACYIKDDSFNLRGQQDLFLYSNVTKVKIEKQSSGSSTHTGSSGTSHGGSSGSF